MVPRARLLLSSPLLEGAVGAVLVIAVWIATQAVFPRAEAGEPAMTPLWGTDYLPVAPVIAPAPLRAGFIDLSYVSVHDQATVNHWEWDFGDGSPARVCFGSQCVPHYRVVHEYADAGVYDVQLLTGGTKEGVARRDALIRAYPEAPTPSDILGFFLRDQYVLLFSPSGEWPGFDVVAQATAVRAVYVMGTEHVERLPVDSGDIHERLQGTLWAVAEIHGEVPVP